MSCWSGSARARELGARQARCWTDELLPALAAEGVRVVACEQLTAHEREAVARRFARAVFPALTPLAVGPAQRFPYISNLSLSLGLLVRDPASGQTPAADAVAVSASSAATTRSEVQRVRAMAPSQARSRAALEKER